MKKTWISLMLLSAALTSAPLFSGCQVSVAGQTLPSPYYLRDDVQYFPKGHEFKLYRESAALKAARAEAELTN